MVYSFIDIFYYFVITLFGLSIGSFMNSWVWRTRENLGISRARSMCPYCRKIVRWYDNIPLLSFLFLHGKCRNCERKIIWLYPVVEFWCGAMFLVVALYHTQIAWIFTPELVRDWIVLVFLTFIFVYDFKYKEILNFTTIPTGVVLFLTSIGFGWHSWQFMILGVLIGSGFFLLLYIISNGAWIGGGDVRLGFFMGVILGYPLILVALLISYVLGAIISLVLVLQKRKSWGSETPFGTYLVIGTIITMFWGQFILDWYINLL
jgi:leader peptidase (prepilin peptidase) / N-methyltransferase